MALHYFKKIFHFFFNVSCCYRKCCRILESIKTTAGGVLQIKVYLKISQFTGKHLCRSPLLKESCRPQAHNFIKKETSAQMHSCKFCEICKRSFFTEHLYATASEASKYSETLTRNGIKKCSTLVRYHSRSLFNVLKERINMGNVLPLFVSYNFCKLF